MLLKCTNKSVLTGDVQHGVPAPGAAGQAGRHTPVHPRVLLLLAMHRAQEEQTPVRQHNPGKRNRSLYSYRFDSASKHVYYAGSILPVRTLSGSTMLLNSNDHYSCIYILYEKCILILLITGTKFVNYHIFFEYIAKVKRDCLFQMSGDSG